MKIPPINNLGRFVVQKNKKDLNIKSNISSSFLQKDTVSFTSSTAYYLKKYLTLPDEIKKILTPEDAINMFQNMELIQKGKIKGIKIGQGKSSTVFENPWLEGYHLLVVNNPSNPTQIIYSRHSLGDSVWSDNDNCLIQIIKAEKS